MFIYVFELNKSSFTFRKLNTIIKVWYALLDGYCQYKDMILELSTINIKTNVYCSLPEIK